jgi:hypothetical protein
MQIKLPKEINELRQRHLEAMAKVDLETITIADRAYLCSSFTGIDIKTIKRMAFDDVMAILEHYFILIGYYKSKELPKELEVDGLKYCLIPEAGKMPTDWHIDMTAFDMADPATIAAFYYIEKGLEYCQKDKNSNILNPIKQRADIFRAHLPANILIDLRFFLQKKLENFKKNCTEKNQRTKGGRLADMIGKTRFMRWLKSWA